MAKNLIGTRWIDASNSTIINIINPATGKAIDTVPESTTKDCDACISSAKKAQRIWGKRTINERVEVLQKFAELVEKDKYNLSSLLCAETGVPISETKKEIERVSLAINTFCEKAKHEYGISIPNNDGTISFTTTSPLGIVLVITPFTHPSDIFCENVIPALLMGNSVIVKPSELAPLTIIKYASLLLEAGLDSGTINVINGSKPLISETLSSNENISLISMTGKTESGLNILKSCSKNLTRVLLNLSSNDSLILDRDGDIDLAVDETIASRLSNNGQICRGPKRFLIHNSVKKEYIRKLKDKVSKLNIGLPCEENTRIGCLISEEAAKLVEEQVDLTVSEGATIIMGGSRKGSFYPPTIIDNVNRNMKIAKDMEVLGPVIPIIGFDDVNEAIKIINQSSYGLSASIICKNINNVMNIASNIECGTIIINGSTIDDFETPCSRRKNSGLGTTGAKDILKEMSNTKTIVLKSIIK